MPRLEEMNRIGLISQELMRRVNEDSRRIRDLEQKLESLEGKTVNLENVVLQRFKSQDGRMNESSVKIKELDEALMFLKANVDKINKQMERVALKVEVKELERAFELLRPGIKTESTT